MIPLKGQSHPSSPCSEFLRGFPSHSEEQVKGLTVQDVPQPLRPRAPFLPVSLDPRFRIQCLPALLSQSPCACCTPCPDRSCPGYTLLLAPHFLQVFAQVPPYGFPCLPAPRPVTLSPPHVLHTQSHSPLDLSSLGGGAGRDLCFVLCCEPE